ncbi:MAG TPA: hypothetical protein VG297_22570 [Bryobacteraceae bacterium]|nr:hypothetical protein [Bryobacteraceae bacterium]
MKAVRGIAGVLLGFGFFYTVARYLAASGIGLWPSLAATIAAGAIAGYIAGLVAGSHEFPWAATVGMGIVGMGVASMREAGIDRPGWYQIAIAGCGPISVMIGAAVRLLTRAGRRTS